MRTRTAFDTSTQVERACDESGDVSPHLYVDFVLFIALEDCDEDGAAAGAASTAAVMLVATSALSRRFKRAAFWSTSAPASIDPNSNR